MSLREINALWEIWKTNHDYMRNKNDAGKGKYRWMDYRDERKLEDIWVLFFWIIKSKMEAKK